MAYPQLDLEHVTGPQVKMVTNYGDIVIQLFPEQAPRTLSAFRRKDIIKMLSFIE